MVKMITKYYDERRDKELTEWEFEHVHCNASWCTQKFQDGQIITVIHIE